MKLISDGLYGLLVHSKVLKHSKPHPSVTPEANTTSFGPNLQPQHFSVSSRYSQSLAHKAGHSSKIEQSLDIFMR